MPTYSIDGPDGKTYSIDGPAGATQDQVVAAIQAHMGQQPAPAAQPSIGSQLLRQVGLTGRYMVEGAASPFATLADVPATAYNTAADAIQGNGQGFRFKEQNQAVGDLLTKIGLPQPETQIEHYIGDASRALSSVGSGLSLGPTLAKAASPVARAVGTAIQDSPLKQAAGAVTGSTAGRGARDLGAPPLLQTAAGLAASTVPFWGGLGGAGSTAAKDAIASVRNQADAAYNQVDRSGMYIDPKAAQRIVTNTQNDLADFGYHPKLQPKASAALEAVSEAIDNASTGNAPITLKGLQVIRRLASNAVASAGGDKSDRSAALIVRDNIDKFVDGITPSDTYGTKNAADLDALKTARALWAKQAKAQAIQDVLTKAQNSQTGFAQSGLENAIRSKFRAFANNDRAMRQFSPTERDAIRAIAAGDFTGNLARNLGRFAPTGPMSIALDAMISGGGAYMHRPEAFALPIAGAAGRAIATGMTKARANNAIMTALGNSAPLPTATNPALSSPGVVNLLATMPGLLLNTRSQ